MTDVTIDEDTSTAALAFTVDDLETGSRGAGRDRDLVEYRSHRQRGTRDQRVGLVALHHRDTGCRSERDHTITLTVSDGTTTATDTFVVTVNAVNDAPTISTIANQSPGSGVTTVGPLAFTVGDVETAAGSLIVTAQSSNPAIVTTAGITLGGSDASRSVQARRRCPMPRASR